jgi:phenylacetate-CoA ligase
MYRFSDRLRKHAVNLHCTARYGWRPWHRGMALGSQSLPHDTLVQKLGFCRWTWVDSSRPVSEWIETYAEVRPHVLHSYPSALREFCLQVKAKGGLSFKPRVLSVGGEFYTPELDSLAQETFGILPFVMYGAMEGGRIAFQCSERRGLHIRMDAVDIEILRRGRPMVPGEAGEVVMTSFINTAMPIIRYNLRDTASWDAGPCPCGIWWPRMSLREGRESDVLALPDGRRIPVAHLGSIVGKSPAIRQFQFVQTSPGRLVLNYESRSESDESIRAIFQNLCDALPGVIVHLQSVDRIARTETGKVPCFVNKMENRGSTS